VAALTSLSGSEPNPKAGRSAARLFGGWNEGEGNLARSETSKSRRKNKKGLPPQAETQELLREGRYRVPQLQPGSKMKSSCGTMLRLR